MKTYELIAPCHFGLEAVLKKEILDLGYEISQVEDGRVTFIGDDEAVCPGKYFPAHRGTRAVKSRMF